VLSSPKKELEESRNIRTIQPAVQQIMFISRVHYPNPLFLFNYFIHMAMPEIQYSHEVPGAIGWMSLKRDDHIDE
jgi:hypothetical protein